MREGRRREKGVERGGKEEGRRCEEGVEKGEKEGREEGQCVTHARHHDIRLTLK